MESSFPKLYKPKPINVEKKPEFPACQPTDGSLESKLSQILLSSQANLLAANSFLLNPALSTHSILSPRMQQPFFLPDASNLFQSQLLSNMLMQQAVLLNQSTPKSTDTTNSVAEAAPKVSNTKETKPMTRRSQTRKAQETKKVPQRVSSRISARAEKSASLSVDQKLDLIFKLKPRGLVEPEELEPLVSKKVKKEGPNLDVSEEDVVGINALREMILRQKQLEREDQDRIEFAPVLLSRYSTAEEEDLGEENENSPQISCKLPLVKLASVSTNCSSESFAKKDDWSNGLCVATKKKENIIISSHISETLN